MDAVFGRGGTGGYWGGGVGAVAEKDGGWGWKGGRRGVGRKGSGNGEGGLGGVRMWIRGLFVGWYEESEGRCGGKIGPVRGKEGGM